MESVLKASYLHRNLIIPAEFTIIRTSPAVDLILQAAFHNFNRLLLLMFLSSKSEFIKYTPAEWAIT